MLGFLKLQEKSFLYVSVFDLLEKKVVPNIFTFSLYNVRIFEAKSVFEKKVVIFTFSLTHRAKLDNVVS